MKAVVYVHCFAVGDNKEEFLQDVFKALNMESFKTMVKQYEYGAKPKGIFLGREEELKKIKNFLEKEEATGTDMYTTY